MRCFGMIFAGKIQKNQHESGFYMIILWQIHIHSFLKNITKRAFRAVFFPVDLVDKCGDHPIKNECTVFHQKKCPRSSSYPPDWP